MSNNGCKEEMISIIVPVFNIKEYISECIDSILHQTYRNLEVIIIDDGSSDGSSDICDNYLNTDHRIKVIHQKNSGLSAARNCGINISEGGGYLLFVDGDDKIDNNMCELLLKNMHMYHADISICNLYNNLQDKEKQKSKIFKLTPQKAIKDMLSEKFFNVSACGKLYKKELFQKIRFPEGVLFEDLATSYRLLDLCNSIVFTSKPLYFYRTRYGSIMNSSFQNEKIVFLDISNEMIQFLKIHYPDTVSAAYNRSTRYCISFIKEIAMTDISYKDYENKLRKFISSHLFAYLKSDYKFSSKLFGFAIVINLTAAKIAYKFISNFSKYFTA